MATEGGRARSEVVRLALAQIDCALGDVAENARRVRQTLAAPTARSADIVVFPELTLTGYSLGHVGEDVSRAVTDAEIAGLATETDRTAFVVGFAEAGRLHTYNSAVYDEGGASCTCTASSTCPTTTSGGAQALHPGSAMRAFDTGFGRMAILLCSDAWQPALAALAVQDGARVLIVPANSAVRRPGHRGAVARHHPLLRPHAAVLSSCSSTASAWSRDCASGAAPTSTARRVSSSPRRRATSPRC